MLRRLLILLLLSLFVAGDVAPAAAQLFGGQQQDQQQPVKKKRRTLFDMLFGGGEDQQQATPPPVVTKPKKGTLPPPPKPAVEKAANATRLAVFGDSMAVDLAAALARLYGDDPNIIVINQGVGSSGFARPDFFDWDKTALDQVQKNSFDIAVMIVGINDRQSIKLDTGSVKPLTPEWDDAYRQRVSAFVSAIHAANKPLIWVGLPPMSKADLSTALGQISSLQRLAVFGGGADFLDIYDKFVDDNGSYAATGPDLNGKIVKMRKDDGIHFTSAGADKLAFYLSQQIKLYYHGGGAVGLTVADALAG
ncbi:MAG TPA: SGNH family hydrolase, partial [Devosia sp.]|nr:SGNH family hydrolase [Devosia sp.]